MNNKYWIVTWETLSKYGTSKTMDVWHGSLADLILVLREANESCVISLIFALQIRKDEYIKLGGEE